MDTNSHPRLPKKVEALPAREGVELTGIFWQLQDVMHPSKKPFYEYTVKEGPADAWQEGEHRILGHADILLEETNPLTLEATVAQLRNEALEEAREKIGERLA